MTSVVFRNPFFKALITAAAMLAVAGASQAAALQYRSDEGWTTYKNERFGFRLHYPSAIYSVQSSKKTEKADDASQAESTAAEAEKPTPLTTEPGNANAAVNVVGPAKKLPAKNLSAIKDEGDPDITGSIPEQEEPEAYKPDTVAESDEAETVETGSDDDAAGNTLTLVSRDGKSRIVVFGALNEDRVSPREYRKILLDEFGGYDKLDYQPIGKTWFVLSGFRGDSIYYQKVMFSCGNRVVNVYSINFPTAEKAFYERLVELMEDKFRTGRGTETPSGC